MEGVPIHARDEIPGGLVDILRNAHLFSGGRERLQKLERQCRALALAPNELLHPEVPADFVVRRGKMRITQFLPDGREITRAVLQAGGALRTRAGTPAGSEIPSPADGTADPQADRYDLNDIVLMALGELELWALPPGMLDEPD